MLERGNRRARKGYASDWVIAYIVRRREAVLMYYALQSTRVKELYQAVRVAFINSITGRVTIRRAFGILDD